MQTSQKGVALITVILVLLVLTVLGITAAVLMTQESRTASRQDQTRAAFYAAEAGLRQGERILQSTSLSSISALLQGPTGQNCSTPTLAVTPNCPVRPDYTNAGTWTAAYLGAYLQDLSASPPTVLANQPLPVNVAAGVFSSGYLYYSLYIRNNPKDPSGSATIDQDFIVQLISAGWVANQDGTPLATKIVEESYSFGNVNQTGTTLQKELSTGATSSAQFVSTGTGGTGGGGTGGGTP